MLRPPLLPLLALLSPALAAPLLGCVYTSGTSPPTWRVTLNTPSDPAAVACGSYTDMNATTSGFGQLSIITSAAFPDAIQMFGAGYLEGVLTAPRISSHATNVLAWVSSQFTGGVVSPQVAAFFAAQDEWSRQQVATNKSTLWTAFAGIQSQHDGLIQGYGSTSEAPLTVLQFQMLAAIGDLLDLIPALNPGAPGDPDWSAMNDTELMTRVRHTTHCSALVKLLPDFSDLYFSHVSWFIYSSTTRIFKHYSFNLALPGAVGNQMSFSSYPAYLSSLDDYYTIFSSGLVVLETTNNVFDKDLYKLVVPQSLFAWHRVRVASLLAPTPTAWGELFGEYNSGTYNNQYIVLSAGTFVPGKPLPPGFLVIVEQLPGLVVAGDTTELLTLGHFPSFNVPYWSAIYTRAGYPALLANRTAGRGGDLGELAGLDWQLAPRAQIFRRDAGKVTDFDSFFNLMRSNAYSTDPLSKGSPWNAICSRGDLAGSPDGCLDGCVRAGGVAVGFCACRALTTPPFPPRPSAKRAPPACGPAALHTR